MSFKEKWKNFITHPYASPLYEFGKATKKTRKKTASLCEGFDDAYIGVFTIAFTMVTTVGAMAIAPAVGFGMLSETSIIITGVGSAVIGWFCAVVDGAKDYPLVKALSSVITSPINLAIGTVKGIKNAIKYKNDVDGYRQMIKPPLPAPTPMSRVSQPSPPQKSRVEVELSDFQDLSAAEQKEFIQKIRETRKDVFNDVIKKEVDTRISIENIDKVKNDIPRKRLHVPHRKRGKA